MTTQHDSETFQPGQQVITVVAAIHRLVDGKHQIFLAKRAATKKFLPSVFELPGGHVNYGETLISALKREVKEEFNADITVNEPFAAFTYMNNIKQTHSVEIAYFAEFINPDQVIALDPEDHSEYIWVTSDNIAKAYTDAKGAEDEEMIVLQRALEILNQK